MLDPDALRSLIRDAVREALAEERAERPAWLTRAMAARHLGVSLTMLERWAFHGGGPPFVKFGKAVRYERAALDEWARARAQTRAEPSTPE